MDGVYMQTGVSYTAPLEASPMQFEGTNTGLLFVGWVPPATRDNPFMQSIVNAGRSVAPYFDAFTPFGYSGPLRPESVRSRT